MPPTPTGVVLQDGILRMRRRSTRTDPVHRPSSSSTSKVSSPFKPKASSPLAPQPLSTSPQAYLIPSIDSLTNLPIPFTNEKRPKLPTDGVLNGSFVRKDGVDAYACRLPILLSSSIPEAEASSVSPIPPSTPSSPTTICYLIPYSAPPPVYPQDARSFPFPAAVHEPSPFKLDQTRPLISKVPVIRSVPSVRRRPPRGSVHNRPLKDVTLVRGRTLYNEVPVLVEAWAAGVAASDGAAEAMRAESEGRLVLPSEDMIEMGSGSTPPVGIAGWEPAVGMPSGVVGWDPPELKNDMRLI